VAVLAVMPLYAVIIYLMCNIIISRSAAKEKNMSDTEKLKTDEATDESVLMNLLSFNCILDHCNNTELCKKQGYCGEEFAQTMELTRGEWDDPSYY
jgi:hypothetical protein